MKRTHKIGLFTLMAALLSALSFPAFAENRVVNVYNWSDYIDPDRSGHFG